MQDPVCMMEVGLRNAGAMAINEGRAYYFCSDACKEIFRTSPATYHNHVSAERLTLGVMGSAGNDSDKTVTQCARQLGNTIADKGLILISVPAPVYLMHVLRVFAHMAACQWAYHRH